MTITITPDLGLACGAFFLLLLLMLLATYHLGYARGSQLLPVEEAAPIDYAHAEKIVENIEVVSFLDISTGPIELLPGAPAIVAFDNNRIAELEASVAREKRLKQRYLRLLRAERAMTLRMMQDDTIIPTPYWRRWVHAQFANENLFTASLSSLQVASMIHVSIPSSRAMSLPNRS